MSIYQIYINSFHVIFYFYMLTVNIFHTFFFYDNVAFCDTSEQSKEA